MKITVKDTIKRALPPCAAVLALCLLLTHTEAAKQGVTEALRLCAAVMVPSLFPMLIVSGYAAACRCPAALQRLFAAPLRALFGLSPGCLTPLLLGLFCGYPMAAKAAAAAREEGLITREDARRLTLFFTCPGAPFAVTVAGGLFHSRGLGWTLLAACAAADGTAALLYRLIARKRPAACPPCPEGNGPPDRSGRLIRSVDGAAKAMLSICAWICAFTALTAVVNDVTGGRWAAALSLTAEVTGALKAGAAAGDLPLTAACLAFGGVCVFCQLLPDLNACGAGAARYLAARGLCAALAYAAEAALLRLLPVPIPTQTRIGPFFLAADSVAGSVALLFLTAVFMAETSRRERFEI